jgi:hypothetical protein
MCLGATTPTASLGHLDHPPNGGLKANYFNVVSTVVARAWYSEATRLPVGVRGCTGNLASDTLRSFRLARYRHEMSFVYRAATPGFSSLVQLREIECESKKRTRHILQEIIVAGQLCTIATDPGRHSRAAADRARRRPTTVSAQRHRSRRVSSPHASVTARAHPSRPAPATGGRAAPNPSRRRRPAIRTRGTPPSSGERAAGAWRRIARLQCLVARTGMGCGSGTVMRPLNLQTV